MLECCPVHVLTWYKYDNMILGVLLTLLYKERPIKIDFLQAISIIFLWTGHRAQTAINERRSALNAAVDVVYLAVSMQCYVATVYKEATHRERPIKISSSYIRRIISGRTGGSGISAFF